ncbi:MAG: SRPBCC domain-containing protein [Bacteroidia bacterium]|nr:SRPBCC domain-containing protein [Bacteroidia bacterium]MCZ2247227.1 SRPBCC domain-containing protein [Bacteroidia bacterium]
MKNFKKYFLLPATAEDIYIALTNPLAIQLWTGERAIMSTQPGSEFSLWDGSISGINLEFEENKKIIQQWFFGEQKEASIVTIKLHTQGNGTSIELEHTNIPEEDFQEIIDGWNETYFASLFDFFDE